MFAGTEFSQIGHIFVISNQMERQNTANIPDALSFYLLAIDLPLHE